MENYSLADLSAVTGNKAGTQDNWMWIIILFLFAGGNGGLFGGGRNDAVQGALTRADLNDGLNFNQLENATRGIQQGLCDGFYAQNTTMLQGFNGLQSSLCNGFNGVNTNISNLGYTLQNCCCETNRNIDSVKTEAYRNTCDITNAIHSEGQATRALITENTIQELRDKLQAAHGVISNQTQSAQLVSELRPYPVPAYVTCSPYVSTVATGATGATGATVCFNGGKSGVA